MKAAGIVILVTLAMAASWLGIRQSRIDKQLRALQAAHEAATRPSTEQNTPAEDALHETEMKLERMRVELAAAEQRFAQATARIEALQRSLDAVTRQIQSDASRPLSTSRDPGATPEPARMLNRSWGTEQVLGPPNTFEAGDIATAWASRNPDGGEEWLKLDYERMVDLAEVRVRETYNPGAISKVTAVLANGQELTIWEGIEPPAQAPVEMSFPVISSVQAKSVKVYLDTKRVPGWNEIDAVELIGRDGTRQWANSASASSTYAEP